MALKAGRLSMEHVSFAYANTNQTISDVSMIVPDGEITALIGPNGSGKSTLFHLFGGMLTPQGGSICLGGTEIRNMRRRIFAQQVSVVHQHNIAPDDMTVRRLVLMGRTAHRKGPFAAGSKEADYQAVERALTLTDTQELADCEVSQLSGGQRQRVWLALALAQSTDILLLDEVTTYLDIHYQIEILELVRRLNKTEGTTVLMVLHDLDQTLEFCDNTVVLNHGRIVSAGKTENIITAECISDVFGVNTRIMDIDGRRRCIFEYGGAEINEK